MSKFQIGDIVQIPDGDAIHWKLIEIRNNYYTFEAIPQNSTHRPGIANFSQKEIDEYKFIHVDIFSSPLYQVLTE
jgi:hypothetical protein